MATNCCRPAPSGITSIAVSTGGAMTVTVADPLAVPVNAETVAVEPGCGPAVTSPVRPTVTVAAVQDHVAVPVTSCVLPSDQVPVAVS